MFKLLVVGATADAFLRWFSGLWRFFLDARLGLWLDLGLCLLTLGLFLELVGLSEEAWSVLLDAPSVRNLSSFLSCRWSCSWKDRESDTLEPRLLLRISLLDDILISSSEESEKFCIFKSSLDGLRAILSLFLLSLFRDPEDLSLSAPLLPESLIFLSFPLDLLPGRVPPCGLHEEDIQYWIIPPTNIACLAPTCFESLRALSFSLEMFQNLIFGLISVTLKTFLI